MQLVLWDIDGTLVDAGGHGRDAFASAFHEVFGRDASLDAVRMGGRTDHWITLKVLSENGVEDGDSHVPGMLEALEKALKQRRERIAAEGRAMPGAAEALAAIGRKSGVTQSLLTGNIEPNAALKLSAFGLDRFVDLEIGGYGSDEGVRSDLVAVAREKARVLRGMHVDVEDIVLIGDTPLDVDAAKTVGARAVGVATGEFGVDDLLRSGADAALRDLTDLSAVLNAILTSSDEPAQAARSAAGSE